MKKKTNRQKRTLIGAVCVAAVIMAGSTFAWFTSQDEVTNRLTASADYGVSIVEDFKPPEKPMTPGQDVNKDVSAVNTGSIDAFVRLALENQLTITTKGSSPFTLEYAAAANTVYKVNKTVTEILPTPYDNVQSAEAAYDTNPGEGVSQTYVQINEKFYIKKVTATTEATTYDTIEKRNDALTDGTTYVNTTTGTAGQPGSVVTVYSEGDNADAVGTFTVTAPVDTAVDYVGTTDTILNKAVKLSTNQSVNANTGKITPNEVTTLQAGGTLVMAGNKILPKSQQFVVAGDDTTPPAQVDYNGAGQYTPDKGAGLYIFKRTVYSGDGNDETEYSGYYYNGTSFYALKTKTVVAADGTSSKTTPYIDFGDNKNGFGLNDNGEITSIDGTISLLTQATYKTAGMGGSGTNLATITPEFGKLTVTSGSADSWTKEESNLNDPTKVNAIKLNVVAPSGTSNNTVIYIKLADNWTTYYTLVEPTTATASVADWFYYNDTVKSGETTEKLVDYVRLANTVSTNDFVELTYDLNAVLNSVQVSYNNEGDETADAVDGTWATPALTTNPVDNSGSVSKITAVSWS